ncbi:hypothetical protein OPIT5_26730 [Opitutaceae bacterium TAV5]|nr:hypothetical protein OPIT5_26730 [Opitutaceae bacterium TAV5]
MKIGDIFQQVIKITVEPVIIIETKVVPLAFTCQKSAKNLHAIPCQKMPTIRLPPFEVIVYKLTKSQ